MSEKDETPDRFRITPEQAAKANEEMQIDALELEVHARNYLDMFLANFSKFRELNPSLVPEVACLVASEGELRRLRKTGLSHERIATMAMHCLATLAEEIRVADAEERKAMEKKSENPDPDTNPQENPTPLNP